nr:MAG TPA: hypothetical protein [Caudoviricetes sp.]
MNNYTEKFICSFVEFNLIQPNSIKLFTKIH